MPLSILDTPLYALWEAAALLRIPENTLRRWLDGWTFRGREYGPVIRPEPTGVDGVTWAEFVEAGFLRGYRLKKVPLQRMRPFIQRMRTEFDVPFPLAHFKPLVANQHLVFELQIESDLHPALFLVHEEADQMIWAEPVREFLERVDFASDADYIARLWPLGKQSPVAIDPEIAFGIPQIRGIRTELIAESVAAGGIEEATRSWEITPEEVTAALTWEKREERAA